MTLGKGLYSLAIKCFVLCLALGFSVRAHAVSMSLSPNLQVVLLAKILMYEKNYRRNGSVSVYVVGAPKVAEAFTKLIGETTGHIDINAVDSGEKVPNKRYDLLYINDIKHINEAKAYAEKHRSVLVTGKKSLVEKGITLGTSAENGRPRFYLNLTSSFSADLDWEPKILAIVGTYR